MSSKLEYNLLAGWLLWLKRNGHCRKLLLDDVHTLIFEFGDRNSQSLSGSWRKAIFEFTAFLVEKKIFRDEPTADEIARWLNEFKAKF